jgi:hypothetical protein
LEVRKRWNNNIAMGFGLLDILIFYGLKWPRIGFSSWFSCYWF